MNRQATVLLTGSGLRVGLVALLLAAALTAAGAAMLALLLPAEDIPEAESPAPEPLPEQAIRAGMLAPLLRAEEPPEVELPAPEPPRDQVVRIDRYGDPLPDGAIVRLGTSRLRHGKYASLSFAADGKTLLSASEYDLAVRVWDPDTGRQLRRVNLQTGRRAGLPDFDCFGILFSQDGKSVLGWSRKSSMRLWDTATGNERCRIAVPSSHSVHRVALSPDGKTVAGRVSDSPKEKVLLWDGTTGKVYPHALPQGYCPEDLAFSPDGKTLATTFSGGFQLWDVATGKTLWQTECNAETVAFSPDGKTLAVGRAESVTLWDVAARKELVTLQMPGSYRPAPTFLPGGTVLAVGGRLWDVAAGKELRELPGISISHVCFAPDGKTLAVSSKSVISLWDVATGQRRGQADGHEGDGHQGEVGSVELLPDGWTLASVSWSDGTARLWNLADGKQLRQLEGQVDSRLAVVAACPDGRTMISNAGGDTLRLLDAFTGKELRRFVVPTAAGDEEGQRPLIHSFRRSTDGTRLAAVSDARDGCGGPFQVTAWDVATGGLLVSRRWPGNLQFPPRLAPDARSVAVWGERDVGVEDVITGEELVTFAGTRYDCPTFSPDGRVLAAVVYTPGTPPSAAFGGPRGEMRCVDLWEVASGKRLLRIKTGPAGFLTFSPDGRVLATASQETISLWDVATGKELFRRPAHEPFHVRGTHGPAFVSSLAFAPDGRTLATGLIDSTVLVWDLAPDTWKPGAAARDLSPDDLADLWSDLASEDAGRAHRAMGVLAAAPAQTVPFLAEQLRPAAVDGGRVRRWIADLDSDEFAVRDAASKALAAQGERLEPLLRRALETKPPLEVRRRLEDLLEEARQAARRVSRTPEVLRYRRVIRTLEWCSTKEAVELLRTLAGGEP
jgi:WD40 repeat protein